MTTPIPAVCHNLSNEQLLDICKKVKARKEIPLLIAVEHTPRKFFCSMCKTKIPSDWARQSARTSIKRHAMANHEFEESSRQICIVFIENGTFIFESRTLYSWKEGFIIRGCGKFDDINDIDVITGSMSTMNLTNIQFQPLASSTMNTAADETNGEQNARNTDFPEPSIHLIDFTKDESSFTLLPQLKEPVNQESFQLLFENSSEIPIANLTSQVMERPYMECLENTKLVEVDVNEQTKKIKARINEAIIIRVYGKFPLGSFSGGLPFEVEEEVTGVFKQFRIKSQFKNTAKALVGGGRQPVQITVTFE